jgi:hypothetical protein
MTPLKNAVFGWLLISGMVLYALTLTAIGTSRRAKALCSRTAGDAQPARP